jgi:hypothetical protein
MSKQSCRNYSIQSSCLPLRPVPCLTTSQTCPFGIDSMIDQRSIVRHLHLKGLSAHAIHDNLVATLGPKAVASSRVTRYLREAKLSTAEVTLNLEPSSPHLASTIPTGISWQHWKKSRFRPCDNLPKPRMSQELPSIEGSQNPSGSYDVFFAGCRNFCQTLRR